MKTEKNIFIAFILNAVFSLFALVGGILIGSTAILSDAIHDAGDAVSIGMSYFLEKKSKKQPDGQYTYGYGRFSVIGSVITTLILLVGSVLVICNAVGRIIHPTPIRYDGMILFALVGVCVNFFAAFFTRHGDSLNQKAVNLHMLEDVLGWLVVLVGAIVMRFTDLAIIDPLMSIGVAVFIFVNALGNLKDAVALFLEKTPHGVDVEEIKHHLTELEGVIDVHHIHVWSMDSYRNFATMHVVATGDAHHVKDLVRHELAEHGIHHVTLELEAEGEHCHQEHCVVEHSDHDSCGHHHHHHHHGHGHSHHH